jgi:hypothetical protein
MSSPAVAGGSRGARAPAFRHRHRWIGGRLQGLLIVVPLKKVINDAG